MDDDAGPSRRRGARVGGGGPTRPAPRCATGSARAGTVRGEPDEHVRLGLAPAVPGAAAPDARPRPSPPAPAGTGSVLRAGGSRSGARSGEGSNGSPRGPDSARGFLRRLPRDPHRRAGLARHRGRARRDRGDRRGRPAGVPRRPRALCSIDCGSYTPAGVNEVGDVGRRRARVEWAPSSSAGRTRTAGSATRSSARSRAGPAPGPRILLIGHMDTVFEEGTVAKRPFRIEDGIAKGPGVIGHEGRACSRACVRSPRSASSRRLADAMPFERITFVANPDEEIGSPSSTPHIVEQAARSTRRSCSSAPAPTARSSRRARAWPTSALADLRARRARRRRAREGPQRDRRRRRSSFAGSTR